MCDLCGLSWRKLRTFEGKLLWMGVPRCLFAVIGALLALEPPIVRAGGGGAETTSCVSDAIAALATLIITK